MGTRQNKVKNDKSEKKVQKIKIVALLVLENRVVFLVRVMFRKKSCVYS